MKSIQALLKIRIHVLIFCDEPYGQLYKKKGVYAFVVHVHRVKI